MRGLCHDQIKITSVIKVYCIHRFVTHLMKRLQHKTVRGISIKLQEEERERRDNYVPETSVLDIDTIEIDAETKDMLKMLELGNIPKLSVVSSKPEMGGHGHPPRR